MFLNWLTTEKILYFENTAHSWLSKSLKIKLIAFPFLASLLQMLHLFSVVKHVWPWSQEPTYFILFFLLFFLGSPTPPLCFPTSCYWNPTLKTLPTQTTASSGCCTVWPSGSRWTPCFSSCPSSTFSTRSWTIQPPQPMRYNQFFILFWFWRILHQMLRGSQILFSHLHRNWWPLPSLWSTAFLQWQQKTTRLILSSCSGKM